VYEIFVLKLGDIEVDGSTIFFQSAPGKKVLKSFYFFCLKSEEHTILLDTGISPEEMAVREMVPRRSRQELLGSIGVRPENIEAIILTHLHNDHFSGVELYPSAVFYVQRSEYRFWSEQIGRFRHLLYPSFARGRPVADIETLHKLNRQNRVRFLDGEGDIFPGVRGIWCGAHTPGSQMILVQTHRGPVLCCSDFIDCTRNWKDQIPPGVLTSLPEWLNGFGKIEQMHLPLESIIPGHDPQLITSSTIIAEDIVKIA
jgi:glyoxylase-like metal-dependent hydrolase (beta-lactamase superfamily II)